MNALSRNLIRFTLALTLLALKLALVSQTQAQTWATNSPLKGVQGLVHALPGVRDDVFNHGRNLAEWSFNRG